MNTAIRVMLVEDHIEYREVVDLALRKVKGIELLETFGAAEVALRSLGQIGCPKPDVILLDLNLPGMNGLEAIPRFKAASGNAKILMLTQSDRKPDVLSAISLGAAGYLLKSATVRQIVDGIRSVFAGDTPLDAGVTKYVLTTHKSPIPRETGSGRTLTKRETEVLGLLADGLTKREIASQLKVSNSTVSTHAVHIFEKLNVQNAPAAVAKAFRMGLFSIA